MGKGCTNICGVQYEQKSPPPPTSQEPQSAVTWLLARVNPRSRPLGCEMQATARKLTWFYSGQFYRHPTPLLNSWVIAGRFHWWKEVTGLPTPCNIVHYSDARLKCNPLSRITLGLYIQNKVKPINAMQDLRFSRRWLCRMASSVMLRRVVLVRTEVSEEFSASFFRVKRIVRLETKLAVTSNRRTFRRNAKSQLALFLVHQFLSPWSRRR
jgi:hypothetical protein